MIEANPDQALSWIARGLSRGQQGYEARQSGFAVADSDLQGALEQSEQLRKAVSKLRDRDSKETAYGNGIGSALLGGALSTLEALAPLALQTLSPGGMLKNLGSVRIGF